MLILSPLFFVYFTGNQTVKSKINEVLIMVNPNQVNMTDYVGGTFRRHQEDILGQLGYTGFNKEASNLVDRSLFGLTILHFHLPFPFENHRLVIDL